MKLRVELTEGQAEALAQLVKRFTYEDAERLANAHDGGRERDEMLEAVMSIQRQLAERGFAPR